jgi:hypothetical protein
MYVNWLFTHGCKQQFAALKRGIDEVVPIGLLQPFSELELDVSKTQERQLLWHSFNFRLKGTRDKYRRFFPQKFSA